MCLFAWFGRGAEFDTTQVSADRAVWHRRDKLRPEISSGHHQPAQTCPGRDSTIRFTGQVRPANKLNATPYAEQVCFAMKRGACYWLNFADTMQVTRKMEMKMTSSQVMSQTVKCRDIRISVNMTHTRVQPLARICQVRRQVSINIDTELLVTITR